MTPVPQVTRGTNRLAMHPTALHSSNRPRLRILFRAETALPYRRRRAGSFDFYDATTAPLARLHHHP